MKRGKLFVITALMLMLTSLAIGSGPSSLPAADVKVETRCGWFFNPTPGNAWLIDRSGEWLIGVQGGHQAEGDWPTFKDRDWVRTNNHYGYGCACMKLKADRETKEVIEIKTARARPLSACRKDRALKEPK